MSRLRSITVRRTAVRPQTLAPGGETNSWVRSHLVVLCRVALLAVVLLLIAGAYFPFAWDPPRTVHNDVTRSADGLRFGEMNNARTPGTPGWLPVVSTTGNIQIHLAFVPRSLQQKASIMMLASDSWHTDFA